MPMRTEVCNFYRDVVATQQLVVNLKSNNRVEKISPLSRWEFCTGGGLAILFLVNNIARSIFFLIGSVMTIGFHEGIKISLLKNSKKGLIHAGAILLGILGILFPQIINKQILNTPS